MIVNECCEKSQDSYDIDGELGSLDQRFPTPKSGSLEISIFKCKICSTGWRRSASYDTGGVVWEDCGQI